MSVAESTLPQSAAHGVGFQKLKPKDRSPMGLFVTLAFFNPHPYGHVFPRLAGTKKGERYFPFALLVSVTPAAHPGTSVRTEGACNHTNAHLSRSIPRNEELLECFDVCIYV